MYCIPSHSILQPQKPSIQSRDLEQSNPGSGGARGTRSGTSTSASCATSTGLVVTSSIIVVLASRLIEIHWNAVGQAIAQNHFANNKRANQQCKEYDEEDEVYDSISPNTSLAQFGLLQRVNWRTNLSTVTRLAHD